MSYITEKRIAMVNGRTNVLPLKRLKSDFNNTKNYTEEQIARRYAYYDSQDALDNIIGAYLTKSIKIINPDEYTGEREKRAYIKIPERCSSSQIARYGTENGGNALSYYDPDVREAFAVIADKLNDDSNWVAEQVERLMSARFPNVKIKNLRFYVDIKTFANENCLGNYISTYMNFTYSLVDADLQIYAEPEVPEVIEVIEVNESISIEDNIRKIFDDAVDSDLMPLINKAAKFYGDKAALLEENSQPFIRNRNNHIGKCKKILSEWFSKNQNQAEKAYPYDDYDVQIGYSSSCVTTGQFDLVIHRAAARTGEYKLKRAVDDEMDSFVGWKSADGRKIYMTRCGESLKEIDISEQDYIAKKTAHRAEVVARLSPEYLIEDLPLAA